MSWREGYDCLAFPDLRQSGTEISVERQQAATSTGPQTLQNSQKEFGIMSQQVASWIQSSILKRRSVVTAAGASLLAPAILAIRPSPAAAQTSTAYDLISSARAASIFAEVIKTHGLEEDFRAAGSFGFFVPVNAAIERTPALQVERFRRDKEYARQVVLNHITNFGEMINGFTGGREGNEESRQVKTKAGYTLTLVTGNGPPRIGGYPITYMNIRASNGFCHALDGVLLV
jgi:uncharacterized surface protein with fasciclin (FAS1) repeats